MTKLSSTLIGSIRGVCAIFVYLSVCSLSYAAAYDSSLSYAQRNASLSDFKALEIRLKAVLEDKTENFLSITDVEFEQILMDITNLGNEFFGNFLQAFCTYHRNDYRHRLREENIGLCKFCCQYAGTLSAKDMAFEIAILVSPAIFFPPAIPFVIPVWGSVWAHCRHHEAKTHKRFKKSSGDFGEAVIKIKDGHFFPHQHSNKFSEVISTINIDNLLDKAFGESQESNLFYLLEFFLLPKIGHPLNDYECLINGLTSLHESFVNHSAAAISDLQRFVIESERRIKIIKANKLLQSANSSLD